MSAYSWVIESERTNTTGTQKHRNANRESTLSGIRWSYALVLVRKSSSMKKNYGASENLWIIPEKLWKAPDNPQSSLGGTSVSSRAHPKWGWNSLKGASRFRIWKIHHVETHFRRDPWISKALCLQPCNFFFAPNALPFITLPRAPTLQPSDLAGDDQWI